jgi:hypothetical protein
LRIESAVAEDVIAQCLKFFTYQKTLDSTPAHQAQPTHDKGRGTENGDGLIYDQALGPHLDPENTKKGKDEKENNDPKRYGVDHKDG